MDKEKLQSLLSIAALELLGGKWNLPKTWVYAKPKAEIKLLLNPALDYLTFFLLTPDNHEEYENLLVEQAKQLIDIGEA